MFAGGPHARHPRGLLLNRPRVGSPAECRLWVVGRGSRSD